MITAVRLLPYNPKKKHKMRTYVSAATGSRYRAGEWVTPSGWRTVRVQREIDELMEFSQFEIREFEDVKQLEGLVQSEMEELARRGLPAVRAHIDTKTEKKVRERGPQRDLSILEPPEPELSDDDPAFDENAAEDDLATVKEDVLGDTDDGDEPTIETSPQDQLDVDIPVGPSTKRKPAVKKKHAEKKKQSAKKKSKNKKRR